MAKKNSLVYEIEGKLPPQDLGLEDVVLGAILIEKGALSVVVDIIKSETFYNQVNQKIYQAVFELYKSSAPIDINTVTDQLRKLGHLESIGGAFHLIELTDKVASSANIEYHARILQQKYLAREMIRICQETIASAYEDTTDVLEMMDEHEKNVFEVARSTQTRKAKSIGQILPITIKEIESKKGLGGVTGITSGFQAVDSITAGWQNSDFIIIASRPSAGKTAYSLCITRNAAVIGKVPVAFFSLEMSASQLVQRLISSEIEIDANKIRNGNLTIYDWQQVLARIGPVSESKIFIDDTPSISVFEMRAKARRMQQEHGIKMIVIDYLQLMTPGMKTGNREQDISYISKSLKAMAKELNIPVIALSQLSREVEKRGGNKRPILSDLRESSALESDADLVIFLHRPEYYGIEIDEEGNSTRGVAEIIIAKHRSGSLGTPKLRYRPEFVKFTNEADNSAFQPQIPLSPSKDFNSTFTIKPTGYNPDDGEDPDKDEAPF